MRKDWIYFRIFANLSDQLWYNKLLSQVVKPFVGNNESLIERFFFFHYVQKYEPEEECESKFTKNDLVAFIRLRVLTQSTNLLVLENNLLELIKKSSAAIGIERCKKYDINGDLGKRFGTERVSEIVDYLVAGSRLTLTMIEGEQGFSPKVADAIHLVCNMMSFRLIISRSCLEQFLKQQSGDLNFMP